MLEPLVTLYSENVQPTKNHHLAKTYTTTITKLTLSYDALATGLEVDGLLKHRTTQGLEVSPSMQMLSKSCANHEISNTISDYRS